MSTNPIIEFLRPHQSVPITPWTGSGRWDINPLRVSILFFGLFIFGLGEAFLIQSNIGNGPWSVLAQGISKHLDISMGITTFGISALVLLAWIPLHEKPGFGTISNIIIIACALQIGIDILPLQNNVVLSILMCLLGIAMIGMASALYITCGLGPGPRDGLMTALHHRSGIRVGRVRLGIEVSVVTLGAILGGNVGIGTILFAVLIGQSVAVALGVVARIKPV